MRLVRRIPKMVASMALVCALFGWETKAMAAPAALKKIVIGVPSQSLEMAPGVWYARERGIYAQEGLHMDAVVMPTNVAMAALTAGEIDYVTTVTSTVNAVAKGLPVKLLALISKSMDWYLIAQPGVKTPADLKGKTVAIGSLRGSSYLATARTLRSLGLDPEKDVKILSAGAMSTRVAGFEAGRFDATALSALWVPGFKKRGFTELAFMGDHVDLPLSGVNTTVKRIQERPAEVRAVLRAVVRGMQDWRGHREEAVQFFMRFFKIDRDSALFAFDTSLRILSKDGTVHPDALQGLVDLAREEMGLKESLSYEQIVDPKPLREVQKELGL
jgi:NitT/TauT family transport system substrate-binding protein